VLREAAGALADERALVRAQRMRQSGASRLRILCDHIFAMERAVEALSTKEDSKTKDEARTSADPPINYNALGSQVRQLQGRNSARSPVTTARSLAFDHDGTVRVMMGQFSWVVRDLGDLVGNCNGGIELDSLSGLILGRLHDVQSDWTMFQKLDLADVVRTLRWARIILRSCYITQAHAIFVVDPVKVIIVIVIGCCSSVCLCVHVCTYECVLAFMYVCMHVKVTILLIITFW
jgi:hypothetical protein